MFISKNISLLMKFFGIPSLDVVISISSLTGLDSCGHGSLQARAGFWFWIGSHSDYHRVID